jgi:phosphoesterase RecJ-like protein
MAPEGPPAEIREALARAADALGGAQRIGVVGHVGPDGDALGSMLAIAASARAAGKEAVCSFGEPFVVSRELRFLDLDPLVPPGEFPNDLDVVVACDTAVRERLGSVVPAVSGASTLIVLDHHASNEGFGDIDVIDPTAAATAQLVFYLLELLEWDLTPDTATALYVGLVTDTGRFQYSMTTPEVHRVAARLLAAGVEPDVVGQHLFQEAQFGYLKVVAAVLDRTELVEDKKFVWSILHRDDLDAAEVTYEDTEGLMDLVRLPEEADVACLLKRLDADTTRGSLRSRGRVDVAAIAALFGGGGHHNAAGFTAVEPPDQVIAAIVDALP